jgi:hypothetical protein
MSLPLKGFPESFEKSRRLVSTAALPPEGLLTACSSLPVSAEDPAYESGNARKKPPVTTRTISMITANPRRPFPRPDLRDPEGCGLPETGRPPFGGAGRFGGREGIG